MRYDMPRYWSHILSSSHKNDNFFVHLLALVPFFKLSSTWSSSISSFIHMCIAFCISLLLPCWLYSKLNLKLIKYVHFKHKFANLLFLERNKTLTHTWGSNSSHILFTLGLQNIQILCYSTERCDLDHYRIQTEHSHLLLLPICISKYVQRHIKNKLYNNVSIFISSD